MCLCLHKLSVSRATVYLCVCVSLNPSELICVTDPYVLCCVRQQIPNPKPKT
jgi:hypothetical protein